jgi:hypothetical protein
VLPATSLFDIPKQLDGDVTTEAVVSGLVNHSHAALADFFDDQVVLDTSTNHAVFYRLRFRDTIPPSRREDNRLVSEYQTLQDQSGLVTLAAGEETPQTSCGRRESITAFAGNLIGTSRLRRVSRARYASPMPPAPMAATIW